MNITLNVKLKKIFLHLLLFLLSIFVFTPSATSAEETVSSPFDPTWLKLDTIADRDRLVNITLDETWQFLPGKPVSEKWMTTFRDGTPFQLNGTVDLDTMVDLDKLPEGENAEEFEGVLYNRFQADRDGIALLGVGCYQGFEAFANGVLCTSTLIYGMRSAKEYSPEDTPFFLPVKQGENLLALRVRRGRAGWKFCCGTPRKSYPSLPLLQHGPWPGNPDAGKMSIRFVTFGDVGSGVEFRKQGTNNWQTQWDHRLGQILRRPFHVVHLDNLEKGARYEYRIVMLDPRDPAQHVYAENGKIHTFHVPDTTQSNFSFFFTSDLQFEPELLNRVLTRLLNAADAGSCDFFVLGGDSGILFSSSELFNVVLPGLARFGNGERPVVMVRGNHELRGNEADQYLYYFGDRNGLPYGIFRYGDTAFLVLDCWEDHPAQSPGADYYHYNLDEFFLEKEKEFLAEALSSEKWTSATRRIVLAHGAPYSTYDPWKMMPFNVQELTDPYFAGRNPQSRVNLWLAGHAHRYTRSIPGTNIITAPTKPLKPHKGGVDYIFPVLTGAGPGGHPVMPASAFRVDAIKGKLIVSAFWPDGTCFEKIEIHDDGSITEIISLPRYEFE